MACEREDYGTQAAATAFGDECGEYGLVAAVTAVECADGGY